MCIGRDYAPHRRCGGGKGRSCARSNEGWSISLQKSGTSCLICFSIASELTRGYGRDSVSL